jgi:hypothetical protein
MLIINKMASISDRHDITEILLKGAFKHHKPNQTISIEMTGLFTHKVSRIVIKTSYFILFQN